MSLNNHTTNKIIELNFYKICENIIASLASKIESSIETILGCLTYK